MNLSSLQYDPRWIEFQFLSTEELADQLMELSKGEDTNTEHYRLRSFRNFMNRRVTYTDIEIEQFITLIKIDPDQAMAGSVLSELLLSQKLNNTQFLHVKSEFIKYGAWANKIVNRIEKNNQL